MVAHLLVNVGAYDDDLRTLGPRTNRFEPEVEARELERLGDIGDQEEERTLREEKLMCAIIQLLACNHATMHQPDAHKQPSQVRTLLTNMIVRRPV